MRVAEGAPAALKGLAIKRLGLGQLALVLEQAREVSDAGERARVRVAQ